MEVIVSIASLIGSILRPRIGIYLKPMSLYGAPSVESHPAAMPDKPPGCLTTPQQAPHKGITLHEQDAPIAEMVGKRQFGQFRGELIVADDFDEPLLEEFWTEGEG